MSLSFQDLIFKLESFWGRQGCAVLEPYDLEMGAGTFHWATTLKALGKEPWKAAFVQPSRRPSDGRYGENPNRLQSFHQFQVILKPSPFDSQDLYLESLKEIGISLKENDIRFVEDDWESPTLGASGLGWEVWCNGQEISQFTYFQYMGGIPCDPIPVELTYGLERIALILQKKDSFLDLNWNGGKGDQEITYGDIFLRREKEFSAFNFEMANTDFLFKGFEDAESESRSLLEKGLVLPAYDYCIKASHLFNLLESRGKISVTERASYIARVRDLARGCCEAWMKSQDQEI